MTQRVEPIRKQGSGKYLSPAFMALCGGWIRASQIAYDYLAGAGRLPKGTLCRQGKKRLGK